MNVSTRSLDGVDYCCTADIGDTLNTLMTPVFIENVLKVPADARRRNAYYWLPEKVPVIRDALVSHLKQL